MTTCIGSECKDTSAFEVPPLAAVLQSRYIYQDVDARTAFYVIHHNSQIDVQRKGVFEPYFEFTVTGSRKVFPIDMKKAFVDGQWTPSAKYWESLGADIVNAVNATILHKPADGDSMSQAEIVFPKGVLYIWSGSDEYVIMGDAYDGSENISRQGYLYRDKADKDLEKGTITMSKDSKEYDPDYKGPVVATMTRDAAKVVIKKLLEDKSKVFVYNDIIASQYSCDHIPLVIDTSKMSVGDYFYNMFVTGMKKPSGQSALDFKPKKI